MKLIFSSLHNILGQSFQQAQLASRVVESGDKKSDSQVNTVLKQHQRQVEELGERMENDRSRQQQLLQERIEAKKHQKERCVLKCFCQ